MHKVAFAALLAASVGIALAAPSAEQSPSASTKFFDLLSFSAGVPTSNVNGASAMFTMRPLSQVCQGGGVCTRSASSQNTVLVLEELVDIGSPPTQYRLEARVGAEAGDLYALSGGTASLMVCADLSQSSTAYTCTADRQNYNGVSNSRSIKNTCQVPVDQLAATFSIPNAPGGGYPCDQKDVMRCFDALAYTGSWTAVTQPSKKVPLVQDFASFGTINNLPNIIDSFGCPNGPMCYDLGGTPTQCPQGVDGTMNLQSVAGFVSGAGMAQNQEFSLVGDNNGNKLDVIFGDPAPGSPTDMSNVVLAFDVGGYPSIMYTVDTIPTLEKITFGSGVTYNSPGANKARPPVVALDAQPVNVLAIPTTKLYNDIVGALQAHDSSLRDSLEGSFCPDVSFDRLPTLTFYMRMDVGLPGAKPTHKVKEFTIGPELYLANEHTSGGQTCYNVLMRQQVSTSLSFVVGLPFLRKYPIAAVYGHFYIFKEQSNTPTSPVSLAEVTSFSKTSKRDSDMPASTLVAIIAGSGAGLVVIAAAAVVVYRRRQRDAQDLEDIPMTSSAETA